MSGDSPESFRHHGTIVPPHSGVAGRLGPYRAIVASGDDPAGIGRIKVIIPELTGEAVHPEWAWPIGLVFGGAAKGDVKFGSLFVPPENAVVDIMFRPGDHAALHPAYMPGWIPQDRTPDVLATNYPNRRGLVSVSGHSLFFDDSATTDGLVQLRQRDGAHLDLPGDGSAALSSKDNNTKLTLQADRPGDPIPVVLKGHQVDCGKIQVTAVANGVFVGVYTPPAAADLPPLPFALGDEIPIIGVITEGSDYIDGK